jgi:hypothetical protein
MNNLLLKTSFVGEAAYKDNNASSPHYNKLQIKTMETPVKRDGLTLPEY